MTNTKGIDPKILRERARVINELLSDTVIDMDLEDIRKIDEIIRFWFLKEHNLSIEGLRDLFQEIRDIHYF